MVPDLAALLDPAQTKRLVVKIGSALLIDDGAPRKGWLATLAADLADCRASGMDIVVVSSGTIALGAARLKLAQGGRGSLADAQASASVGQVSLARLWAEAFDAHGIVTSQVLLTPGDLEDRRRYLNASDTLERLLELGAVPVINENDSVATKELRFGDNDRLAARVGQAVSAQTVLILSDVAGLYDRNPAQDGAKLIPRVEGVTPEVMAMAGADSGSGLGSGGMRAKLQAAQIAERADVRLGIIDGREPHPLTRFRETGRGTVFIPVRADSARKAWLGGRLAIEGVLNVDDGCASALANGASLLAAGVTGVEGDFARGALVGIHGPEGERLGRGLVAYSAAECRTIMGRRESDQEVALGYAPRAAVVHRDDMVQE